MRHAVTRETTLVLIREEIGRKNWCRSGVDISKIGEEAVFQDLGVDSLHIVELSIQLENRLDFHLPDEETVGIRTVGDLVAKILRYAN